VKMMFSNDLLEIFFEEVLDYIEVDIDNQQLLEPVDNSVC